VSDRSGGTQRTDQELISAVVAGDHRVAAELYSRLASVVDRTLLRIFGRREVDHDDLMQTAFEQIVLTLTRQSYAGNCSLKTWAARVTSNVGLNALRSRRRERRVVDRNSPTPADSPCPEDLERSAHARSQLKAVMAELAAMNQRRAQAVFLHDLEGYALQEIADITGLSVAAAQSRLVRGRAELLKRLERRKGIGRKGDPP
jgi:RNA polymerase sigma-70 factor, ECF subfamily